jgi:hypothetical protein
MADDIILTDKIKTKEYLEYIQALRINLNLASLSSQLSDRDIFTFYRWIGGDCEENDVNIKKCDQNIQQFYQVFQESGRTGRNQIIFQPFKKLSELVSEIIYNKENNNIYIVLSNIPGEFLYVFRNENNKIQVEKVTFTRPIDTLYVFDFDFTLTSLFTCNKEYKQSINLLLNPSLLREEDEELLLYFIMGGQNIEIAKANIENFKEFVKYEISKGNKIAIASFGNKKIISKVMEKIFYPDPSPFDPNTHIITEQDYREGEGCMKPRKESGRSKLNYINEIIVRNNIEPKKIYLIDDDIDNINIVNNKQINGVTIKGIHIPVDDNNLNPGFSTTLKFIPM